MVQPLISIITVTYNSLNALKITAKSALEQDYSHKEYIIVDGGSGDGSKQWIEQLANTASIRFVSEPDNGIYDAMNKAVKMAKGDYCIFMNAGDTFVKPETLSEVVAQMRPNMDVVYGDVLKNGMLKASLKPQNCHKMFYCHQSALTSTACLKTFPFDTNHRWSADFKQAKQLILAGKSFQYIPIAIANFDTNGVSNIYRSRGLWDNIKVVCEVDGFVDKLRFLPHLVFPWLMCKLRGK